VIRTRRDAVHVPAQRLSGADAIDQASIVLRLKMLRSRGLLKGQDRQAHEPEQTILADLRAVLSDNFCVPPNDVHLDADFVAHLGVEAADVGYLMLALEEAFDVEITAEDASRIIRVRDAINCISNMRGQLNHAHRAL
jgi:acyl carrier protein